MGTLWTPGGERPIRREPEEGPAAGPPGGGADRGGGDGAGGPGPEDEARLADLQDQLARTPAEVIVANHAFGLFELAALHLSLQPPQLPQAQLAIDALGALVEGMKGRLGDYETELQEGLANLRLAYVQLSTAFRPPVGGQGGGEGGGAG